MEFCAEIACEHSICQVISADHVNNLQFCPAGSHFVYLKFTLKIHLMIRACGLRKVTAKWINIDYSDKSADEIIKN
jgi:hypothetical protein